MCCDLHTYTPPPRHEVPSLIYKDVTGKFQIGHVFSSKVYPRRLKVSQNAGKFAWQIIYRTKEKCLETKIGYVIKKLAE